MENYGYYPDDEEVVEKGFSFGKLIKYIATAFVIAIWVIVLFRIWVSGETKFSKSFMWTPESIAAYNESPDDFKILQYELKSYTKHFENPDGSLSAQQFTRNNITDDGFFKVSQMMYVEATKELQFTVRYTTAAVEDLTDYYMLPEKPKGVPFHFVIYEKDTYFDEYEYSVDTRFIYTYCRVVYKGIDIENFDYLYLNVFYNGFADFQYPYSSLMIYDSYLSMEEYKIKKALPAELYEDFRQSLPVAIKNPPTKDGENENGSN